MIKLHPSTPLLILLIFLVSGFTLSAKEAEAEKIDSIFESWDNTHVPGGTIAIYEHGTVTFVKAYGMASLEYNVPNTRETIYNLASVSKQFTAFGIVLLEQQGKLSFDDDIRIHLPNLPDFGETITIRHMLHHTSGMRSLHALLGMAGWRGDDRRSNEDLMRFMEQQRELNFKPGDEYSYCNTGYMFMADIIEKISGLTFEEWMQTNVFEPLGMDHSFVRRDINQIVPGVATSYYGSDNGGFRKAVEYWAYVGSGNMHSTVDDVVKWFQNFNTPGVGGAEAIVQMQQRGTLNDGDTIPYAFGINVDTYRGIKRMQHGGSIGGYRTNLAYFPDHETGIIVLSNFSSANANGKTRALVDLVMSEHLEPNSSIVEQEQGSDEEIEPWNPDTEELKLFFGRYYSPELDTYYSLRQTAPKKLMFHHQRHGDISVQLQGKDEMRSERAQYQFERDQNKNIKGMRISNGRARNVWFEKIKE